MRHQKSSSVKHREERKRHAQKYHAQVCQTEVQNQEGVAGLSQTARAQNHKHGYRVEARRCQHDHDEADVVIVGMERKYDVNNMGFFLFFLINEDNL